MNPHLRTGRRRLVSLAGAVAVFAWALPAPAVAVEFTTTAPQGYLIDAETGTVLLAKEADQPMPPASMSKLMTVYMTFEALKDGRLSMDTELPVSREAWQKGGSKMFVEVDTMVPVIDLLRGVIVQSGNDASIVLAEGIGGTESGFASLMNHRARELGLQDSNFTNSTGWPDPNHVMSPRDLALLTVLIVDHFPEYFPLFSETEYTYGGIKQQNRNPLLHRNMGAEGMKTGYTKAAGYGLTASALRNGRRLVLVLNGMNSPRQRVSEATRLLELAFAQTEAVHLAERISNADLVITGEGRLDTQSAYGKTVAGVAALAEDASVPCLAVAGLVEGSAALPGLLDIEASTPPGMSIEEAMSRADELVPAAVERLLRRYSR